MSNNRDKEMAPTQVVEQETTRDLDRAVSDVGIETRQTTLFTILEDGSEALITRAAGELQPVANGRYVSVNGEVTAVSISNEDPRYKIFHLRGDKPKEDSRWTVQQVGTNIERARREYKQEIADLSRLETVLRRNWNLGLQKHPQYGDKPIGKGGTARVYAAQSPEGDKAIKIFRGDRHNTPEFVEVERLVSAFLAQNGVAVAQPLELDTQKHQYIASDSPRALAFSLHTPYKSEDSPQMPSPRADPSEFLTYIADHFRIWAKVTDILYDAAQKGIAHGDVKPENILLDSEGNPLVTDLSLASADAQRLHRFAHNQNTPEAYQQAVEIVVAYVAAARSNDWREVGSEGYLAPEAADQRLPAEQQYLADIRSLGISVHQLFRSDEKLRASTQVSGQFPNTSLGSAGGAPSIDYTPLLELLGINEEVQRDGYIRENISEFVQEIDPFLSALMKPNPQERLANINAYSDNPQGTADNAYQTVSKTLNMLADKAERLR